SLDAASRVLPQPAVAATTVTGASISSVRRACRRGRSTTWVVTGGENFSDAGETASSTPITNTTFRTTSVSRPGTSSSPWHDVWSNAAKGRSSGLQCEEPARLTRNGRGHVTLSLDPSGGGRDHQGEGDDGDGDETHSEHERDPVSGKREAAAHRRVHPAPPA